MSVVLYIHGMGGGRDSRIPSILNELFHASAADVEVIVKTYDFDPEVAAGQINKWIEELRPSVVVGESLGALHAMRVKGIPLLFVSPAINAPLYFELLAWLSLIPGVTWLFDRIYKPREGERQKLHFTFRVLRKYHRHRKSAFESIENHAGGICHAFFGSNDHYRRSGVVSIHSWRKHVGNSFSVYNGTHFMEEEHVIDKLAPAILEVLNERNELKSTLS